MIPGEYVVGDGDIVANAGRRTLELTVENTGDRPIQVGSHFHFFEVNRALRFERARAFGMRLNVPAGTAVRFEPGDAKRVTLVELGGRRKVYGLNALTEGGDAKSAARRLAEWERLLAGPAEGVLEALTSRTPRARELRQNSPFAGVLSEEERHKALSGFSAIRHKSS